jgi:beta-phosphoglucomutase
MQPVWPSAILFDFDGVIVNSEPLHFLALNEVLSRHGIDLSESQYYDELLGLTDRDAVRRIFERHDRPLEPKTFLAVLARKSRAMMDLIEQRRFSALRGAEAFIRGLWRNYPLAICSGALRDEIDAMLLGVSLRDCFDVIVSAEDVTVGKPDPSGYIQAMEQLGQRHHRKLKPQDCLIVEDAPSVVRSVKAAGFSVLAVTTSTSAERLADADFVVPSLEPGVVLGKIPSLKMTM